jgi:putative restriction endonuclease
MRTLQDYLQILSSLNVSYSKEKGKAPYKPILLLVVIDLIAQGLIKENKILVSDNLIEIFDKYWSALGKSAYKGGLTYPFFHLKNDGFWHLEFQRGFEGSRPRTVNQLKKYVQYASLDDNLFNFLQNQFTRQTIVDVLVEVWFSDKYSNLENILQLDQDFQEQIHEELGSVVEQDDAEPKAVLKKSYIRNPLFRKTVVFLYGYRCAFCELKILQSSNQVIVDGAHIKPFAKFFDDKIDNGISFCKNHHWAFDQGLFSIGDEYKILISKRFQEESPFAKSMKEFEDKKLLLPDYEAYFPRLEAVQWHRENVFIS